MVVEAAVVSASFFLEATGLKEKKGICIEDSLEPGFLLWCQANAAEV